jgi:transposase
LRLVLTAGQVSDSTQAAFLLEGIKADAVLGDKGYDTDAIVETIKASGAGVIIPPKENRIMKRLCDYALYRERNLVERFFNKLKHFRAIATRYAKRKRNYYALVTLVSALLWMK